jgi:hypothetical protein
VSDRESASSQLIKQAKETDARSRAYLDEMATIIVNSKDPLRDSMAVLRAAKALELRANGGTILLRSLVGFVAAKFSDLLVRLMGLFTRLWDVIGGLSWHVTMILLVVLHFFVVLNVAWVGHETSSVVDAPIRRSAT